MASHFCNTDPNKAACIVVESDIEIAFIKAIEKQVRSVGSMPSNLVITARKVVLHKEDRDSLIETASRKFFQRGSYDRRVVLASLEGISLSEEGLVQKATGMDIELIILRPCIERHLLSAYGIQHSLLETGFSSALNKHFSNDYRPEDSDWHLHQIRTADLDQMIQRDPQIHQLHKMIASIDHPSYR